MVIIFMFLIGEFPTHFSSRTSALSILYAGDESQLESNEYAIFKFVTTVLLSIHYSCNFVLYCVINRKFRIVFARVFCCGASEDPRIRANNIIGDRTPNINSFRSAHIDKPSPSLNPMPGPEATPSHLTNTTATTTSGSPQSYFVTYTNNNNNNKSNGHTLLVPHSTAINGHLTRLNTMWIVKFQLAILKNSELF